MRLLLSVLVPTLVIAGLMAGVWALLATREQEHFDVWLGSTTVSAGDNLEVFANPPAGWPCELTVYYQNLSERFTRRGTNVRGQRTFNVRVSPKAAPGSATLLVRCFGAPFEEQSGSANLTIRP